MVLWVIYSNELRKRRYIYLYIYIYTLEEEFSGLLYEFITRQLRKLTLIFVRWNDAISLAFPMNIHIRTLLSQERRQNVALPLAHLYLSGHYLGLRGTIYHMSLTQHGMNRGH